MIKYSVIIPTFNGASRLPTAIDALLRQSVRADFFEIIIISDCSTDNTDEMIREYKISHPEKKFVYKRLSKNQGPPYARNEGIKVAKGDIIFFLDDDCEPPALWMEKFLDIYDKHPDVVGVGGWYYPSWDSLQNNIYEQFIYLRYRFFWGLTMDYAQGKTGELYPLPAGNGGNFSVKKWIFKEVGFYNTIFHFAGGIDDFEFARRIQKKGFKLYYLPVLMLHKKEINTFSKYLKFCISRAKALKLHVKLYSPPEFTASELFEQFVKFCQYVKNTDLPFTYNKNVLYLGFLYFFLNDIILHLPFSYEKRGNE